MVKICILSAKEEFVVVLAIANNGFPGIQIKTKQT
jgi:hypothetical protein